LWRQADCLIITPDALAKTGLNLAKTGLSQEKNLIEINRLSLETPLPTVASQISLK